MTRKQQIELLIASLSEEALAFNPYYESLKNSDWGNRTDLQTSFLEWEATQRMYQQQLGDQRSLRDEDRAYNDAKSQVERLRAAGINPDIDGGSVSGSGSGSGAPSVPSPAQWKSQPASDKIESVQVLSSVIQSSIASFSQLGQLANSFVDFSKNLSLYDESLAVGNATARQAVYGADLTKLSTVGKYAEFLPKGEDLTAIDIDKFAKDMFIEDPSIIEGLKHYVSSPEAQKLYYDKVLQSKKSFWQNSSFDEDRFFDIITRQQESDFVETRTRKILSEFLYAYNLSFYGDSDAKLVDGRFVANDNVLFARKLGAAARESAYIESDDNLAEQRFTAEKNQRTRDIFKKQLNHVVELAQSAKSEADKLLAGGLTQDEWPLYASHMMSYSRMLTLGNEVLNQVYDHYDDFVYKAYTGESMLQDGNVNWVDTELLTHRLDYAHRIYFNDIIKSDNASEKVESVLSQLTDFAKSFVGKGKGKGKN